MGYWNTHKTGNAGSSWEQTANAVCDWAARLVVLVAENILVGQRDLGRVEQGSRTMNGYEKSVALNLTGTDAEIVAILKTLAVGDIRVDAVRTWMREHMIWYRGSDGLMKGSLATAYATALTGQQVSLDYLHATVWGDSATVLRTTDPFWAPQVADLVGLVAALVPAVAALVDEFYDLDGGRPYLALTAVEFAAQRTEAADAATIEIERAAIESIWTNAQNEGGVNVAVASGDRAGLIVALNAAVVALGA
jgi:hypothetical protein